MGIGENDGKILITNDEVAETNLCDCFFHQLMVFWVSSFFTYNLKLSSFLLCEGDKSEHILVEIYIFIMT